jgi:hypothetical protein
MELHLPEFASSTRGVVRYLKDNPQEWFGHHAIHTATDVGRFAAFDGFEE